MSASNDNADPRRFCSLHAHDLCDVRVARAKLMCLPHWRRVPTLLQSRVYDAWRTFQRTRTRETLHALFAVQKEATDAVVTKLRGTP